MICEDGANACLVCILFRHGASKRAVQNSSQEIDINVFLRHREVQTAIANCA